MASSSSLGDSQYPISNISPPTSASDVDSLPDSAPSDDIDDEEDSEDGEGRELSDAEKQWEESLQQMELLLTMVLIPYVGKYFGRKFAYYGKATIRPLSLETS